MCYIVLSSAILATGHRILGAKEEIIINLWQLEDLTTAFYFLIHVYIEIYNLWHSYSDLFWVELE
jgi:hypothetical protein